MLTTSLFFIYMSFKQPLPQEPPKAPAEANANDNPLLNAQAPPEKKMRKLDQLFHWLTFQNRWSRLDRWRSRQKFNLMVTINSHGASVERVELVGQSSPGQFNFMALEHEGGYLGYMSLAETAGGLRVRVVPDGSPAAMAKNNSSESGIGIQVGDLITQVAESAVTTPEDIAVALKKSKPGQTVPVHIDRGGQKLVFDVVLSQAPWIYCDPVLAIPSVYCNDEINSLRTTIASLNSTKFLSANLHFQRWLRR